MPLPLWRPRSCVFWTRKALSLGKQCLCCQPCPSLVPAAWGCSLGPISSAGLRVPEVLQPLCVGPAVEQCRSIARKDCPGHIAQGYVKRWGSAVGTRCAWGAVRGHQEVGVRLAFTGGRGRVGAVLLTILSGECRGPSCDVACCGCLSSLPCSPRLCQEDKERSIQHFVQHRAEFRSCAM